LPLDFLALELDEVELRPYIARGLIAWIPGGYTQIQTNSKGF
jgi:hypothetical protein